MIHGKKRRLIIIIILVAIIVYGLFLVRSVITTFLLSALVAYLLNPIVCYLEKNQIKRTVAIVLIYFTAVSAMFSLAIIGFPILVNELNDFADTIPIYTEQLRQFVQQLQQNYQRIDLPENIKQVIDETIWQIEARISELLLKVAQGIINLFSRAIYFVIIPVLSFYILKDWHDLEKRSLRMLPIPYRTHVANLSNEINLVLKKFIRGHLIVATIVGILTAISLSLLGVEFALILGIIAGVADLIPYFGPIIGIIPAVMIGLLESQALAIKIVITMVLIQQLESNLISPKILGDSVGLHPISIIFVLLAGGHLFGLIGMLLAVPVTVVCRTLFIYFYEHLID